MWEVSQWTQGGNNAANPKNIKSIDMGSMIKIKLTTVTVFGGIALYSNGYLHTGDIEFS